MNSQHEFDDVIDLTSPQNTRAPHTSYLSNSVIIIDSDDSFISSPVIAERFIRKSQNKGKTGSENLQKTIDQSQRLSRSKGRKKFGECPICWDELGTKPLASTICGHVYCIECIKKALCTEKRCPVCRTILKGNLQYHPLYLGR